MRLQTMTPAKRYSLTFAPFYIAVKRIAIDTMGLLLAMGTFFVFITMSLVTKCASVFDFFVNAKIMRFAFFASRFLLPMSAICYTPTIATERTPDHVNANARSSTINTFPHDPTMLTTLRTSLPTFFAAGLTIIFDLIMNANDLRIAISASRFLLSMSAKAYSTTSLTLILPLSMFTLLNNRLHNLFGSHVCF